MPLTKGILNTPLAVRYFSKLYVSKNRIIDFYQCPDETRLSLNGLDINNLVSYGADNASVNYGRHHSVYTNIKQLCPKLISSNCNCHVIHNCARFGCKLLTHDVELLVMKISKNFLPLPREYKS